MSRRKIRAAVAVAIIGGFIAVGAATSFAAAPLSSATAGGHDASGTALGVPGTVSVSESVADEDSASWSALSVAGTSVLGVDDSGTVGPAAAVMGLAGTLSEALCPNDGGPLAANGVSTCVVLLPSGAYKEFGQTGASGSVAGLSVVYDDGTDARGALLEVLPSGAGKHSCGSYGFAAITQGVAVVTPGSVTPLNLGVQQKEYQGCRG